MRSGVGKRRGVGRGGVLFGYLGSGHGFEFARRGRVTRRRGRQKRKEAGKKMARKKT